MFLAALLSEVVNDRSLVSMLEDMWALPFLIVLRCLPANPNPWSYYVSYSYELVVYVPVLIGSDGS